MGWVQTPRLARTATQPLQREGSSSICGAAHGVAGSSMASTCFEHTNTRHAGLIPAAECLRLTMLTDAVAPAPHLPSGCSPPRVTPSAAATPWRPRMPFR